MDAWVTNVPCSRKRHMLLFPVSLRPSARLDREFEFQRQRCLLLPASPAGHRKEECPLFVSFFLSPFPRLPFQELRQSISVASSWVTSPAHQPSVPDHRFQQTSVSFLNKTASAPSATQAQRSLCFTFDCLIEVRDSALQQNRRCDEAAGVGVRRHIVRHGSLGSVADKAERTRTSDRGASGETK